VILQLAERRNPLVITQNGEAKAVIQGIVSSEETQQTLALLKVLERQSARTASRDAHLRDEAGTRGASSAGVLGRTSSSGAPRLSAAGRKGAPQQAFQAGRRSRQAPGGGINRRSEKQAPRYAVRTHFDRHGHGKTIQFPLVTTPSRSRIP
jgi:prevent-host-death family protein